MIDDTEIHEAESAALEVLHHNAHGPFHGLPRTAGWGYPEPYTRDMMICGLGIMASGDGKLMASLERVLTTLAANQTSHGHIPSLVHDPQDRGASDCTPLFVLTAAIYRRVTGRADFLTEAVDRAAVWMDYQSPDDRVMVAQLPTSDWRDEQWFLGYPLFINTVVYGYLRLLGRHAKAERLRSLMARLAVRAGAKHRHVHVGLALPHKPYYASWTYKSDHCERFDLLGNSLAILTGVAGPSRAREMVAWIDQECDALRARGELAVDLPPNYFPYILPEHPEWRPRYERFNQPGEYHNGGVWPFVCGFYVAALVAAGRQKLAERKLAALTKLVRPAREQSVAFGFNEWFKAQDGRPCGQDWQSWSAAMYLYAAACVRQGKTPFFEWMR